jgi:hypothetical protein
MTQLFKLVAVGPSVKLVRFVVPGKINFLLTKMLVATGMMLLVFQTGQCLLLYLWCVWLLSNYKVQEDLVICGLFICEFAYMRLRMVLNYRTYPLIYSHPWSFYTRIHSSPILRSLSIAYNEVRLYYQVSHDRRSRERSLKR